MQSIYFQNKVGQINDKFMFLVYFCPVFIIKENNFLWRNSNPNSVSSTFLLELHFIKENDRFSSEIFEKYSMFFSNIDNFDFKVSFFPTMMDQKSINCCTILKPEAKGCDSMLCFVCKCRSQGANSFQDIKTFTINKSNLIFGISPLHALLNFTKFLIFNISVKLNSFTKEELNNLLENKFNIKFSEVEHGFGSKITGNVARLFFKDLESFSHTIPVPINAVEDINIILNLIRQSEPVDKQFYLAVSSRIKHYLNIY